jgi:hypothetical protein
MDGDTVGLIIADMMWFVFYGYVSQTGLAQYPHSLLIFDVFYVPVVLLVNRFK